MKDFRNTTAGDDLTVYLKSSTNNNIDFMNSSFTITFRSANPEKNEKFLQIFDPHRLFNGLWIK